jgi:hypothetical protein
MKVALRREYLQIGTEEVSWRGRGQGLIVLRRCPIEEVELATSISDIGQTPKAESLWVKTLLAEMMSSEKHTPPSGVVPSAPSAKTVSWSVEE